jgi:alpha-L-arabinofuranosidase
VAIANRSNLINSFCSGCIQTDNHRLYKTPTYHAQKLYATMAGDRPLRIEASLPPLSMPDLSATLSSDGKSVILFAVNDQREAIERPLDFSAFGRDGQTLEVWTLTDTRHAGEPDATNSFADPDRVVPVRSTFEAAAPRFNYRFPPLSLTVVRWSVRETGGGRGPVESRLRSGNIARLAVPLGVSGRDASLYFGMEEREP